MTTTIERSVTEQEGWPALKKTLTQTETEPVFKGPIIVFSCIFLAILELTYVQ